MRESAYLVWLFSLVLAVGYTFWWSRRDGTLT
jgi:hypothetical protein